MRRRRNPRSRRGAATLELILVVPILLIVLVFSIQFGIVALYQAAVVHSATVAAREAGKGADFNTVVAAVQKVVDVHDIDIDDASGSGTKVVLEDGDAATMEFGDDNLSCPTPENALDPKQVRVNVCVDLAATRFCDALAAWGVTFAGRTLRASSLVVKEHEQDISFP